MSQSNNLKDPLWASLPVVKFSHLTCFSGRRCPAWTHVTASDLSFVVQAIQVVDEFGSYDRRIVMKIFRGQEILEMQDLGQVVQHYRQPVSPTEPEGAVEVMTRGVSMAMRYPKTPDSMRKIQLRFRDDLDCAKASGIMRDLGLSINEVGNSQPAQSSRPIASPTRSLLLPLPGAESAGSVGLLQESRPVSVLASLGQLSQDRSYGVLSSSPHFGFKVPERPVISESRSDLSYFTSKEAPSDFASMATPDPHLLRTSFAPELEKPSYFSQTERELQPREISQLAPQDFGPGSVVNQSTSTYLRQMQVQRGQNADKSGLSSSSPFFNAPLTSIRHPEPSLRDPSWVSSQRPASTPADLEDLIMPPRRKLPFERPDPAIRSSSAISFPALPKPTPVSRTSPRIDADNKKQLVTKAAPIKRVAQRKGPIVKSAASSSNASSPSKPATREKIIAPPQPREDDSSPLAAKSAAAAAATSRPASVASGMVSKAKAPSKKRVTTPILPPPSNKRLKMVSRATQTETIISSGSNIAGQDDAAQCDNAHELVPEVVAAASPPDTYLNDLDTFIAKHKERSAPKEIWQTPGYAEADAEHRQMIVDNFICENLESADFLQLCVDVETAWRKIGLGF
ncbi:hypothetical protein QTJ16_003110 [Diplocarpon rosae]|uniref:Uncharacterized protein n=1 Tax=Diplocarpon rosae TaxID=946125 RepID=A0AAD9T222_9HELO|nr:hypothetical protein QTJ16_003110 [Diplocarpon rosae]